MLVRGWFQDPYWMPKCMANPLNQVVDYLHLYTLTVSKYLERLIRSKC